MLVTAALSIAVLHNISASILPDFRVEHIAQKWTATVLPACPDYTQQVFSTQ